MARSIMDLSLDELEALAKEAGAEAIARAHAAGLPTTGFVDGMPVFALPDGTIARVRPAPSSSGTTASSESETLQTAESRSVA